MKKKIDICEGPILKNIIRYTIPLILTNLLQIFYNAADTVVVGRFCGSQALAAMSATASPVSLIVNFLVGLSTGAAAVIAHCIGAKDEEKVKQAVHTSMAVWLVGGVLVTASGFVFCEPLLRLLKTPEDILAPAALYMKIYFCGMIFNMFCFFAGAVINANGETQKPLKILSISGVTNVVLNVIFVTVFHFEIFGVALATIISQVVSAVLFAADLLKRRDASRVFIRQIKFHKSALLRILGVGIPTGLQGTLFAASNAVVQASFNSFGTVILAGNAAAGNVDFFVYTVVAAFSQTALTFVSQNMGAKNHHRIKKIILLCCLCTVISGLTLGLVMLALGKQLLSLYITDSPEAITFGMRRFLFIGPTYFLAGVMEVFCATNRGINRATPSMIISVVSTGVLRVLWVETIFKIPPFNSYEGLLFSYPVTWLICIIAQFILFTVCFRKILKNKILA